MNLCRRLLSPSRFPYVCGWRENALAKLYDCARRGVGRYERALARALTFCMYSRLHMQMKECLCPDGIDVVIGTGIRAFRHMCLVYARARTPRQNPPGLSRGAYMSDTYWIASRASAKNTMVDFADSLQLPVDRKVRVCVLAFSTPFPPPFLPPPRSPPLYS